MNERQREIQRVHLENEKAVLEQLKRNYKNALDDIQRRMMVLQADEAAQSKIYQVEYQQYLEKQISAYLDVLEGDNHKTITDYLNTCYEDGFIGAMYDLQGQGVPLVLPFDQNQVIKVITMSNDSIKLSQRLYANITGLKDDIRAEIARGISNGYSYFDIARNLASYTEADLNKSYRIARTEGHRVQQESAYDALYEAKEHGADIVKEWCSALDDRTRETHRALNGILRELDDFFEVDGKAAMYPGAFGIAEEDINCRCCILQRARWALSEEELQRLQADGVLEYYEEKEYNKFKDRYQETINKESRSQSQWAGLKYQATDYQTKSELIKHLYEEYNIIYKESTDYNMDFQLMKESVIWLDKFNAYFSEFKKNNPYKLPLIRCNKPEVMNGAVAIIRAVPKRKEFIEMIFNGAYFRDANLYAAYVEDRVKSKWYPANATLNKTFVHEYGHYVSTSLGWYLEDEDFQHNFLQACRRDYKELYGVDLSARTEVSRYAASREADLFAESFAEFFGGENPRRFAALFGEKLEQLLKGVK